MSCAAGVEISSDGLTRDDARRLVISLRATIAAGADAGVVVCSKSTAYVERSDPAFFDGVDPYYRRLKIVDDLLAVIDDEVLKIAVYDLESSERNIEPALAGFRDTHLVTVSGEHWIDVTSKTANKGAAITQLQDALGITPAQTMVFGDFLNDLEMMDAADYSLRDGQRAPAATGTGPLRRPGQLGQRGRPDDRVHARHIAAVTRVGGSGPDATVGARVHHVGHDRNRNPRTRRLRHGGRQEARRLLRPAHRLGGRPHRARLDHVASP